MNSRRSYRTSSLPALCALALATLLLLMPVPTLGRAGCALLDLVHVPLFALLSALAYTLFVGNQTRHRWLFTVVIWCFLASFGIVAEWLQAHVGRSASAHDAFANAAGAAAGLFWVIGRRSPHPARRVAMNVGVVGLILAAFTYPLLVLLDVYLVHRSFPVLASFEQPLELWRWTPLNAKLQRSPKYATNGSWSLRIDWHVAKYPAAALSLPARDWTPYEELVFDIVWDASDSVATTETLLVIVKVQDEQHNDEYQDRFHQQVTLRPGQPAEVRVPLMRVAYAPQDRVMDMSRIDKVELFTVRPQTRLTLYLDNMRLE
ncbi:MAG: VanZ family protein [Planctomycetota bacterium]|nr:VanZ family protein [Planctomycetota bacterium]